MASSFLSDAALTAAGLLEVFENACMNVRHMFSSTKESVPFESSMRGKKVLITGGSFGIGKATAELLSSRGASVIVTSRDLHRANASATSIQRAAKNGKVRAMALDLASLHDVERFCDEAAKEEIDVVICNAGIMCPPERIETEDGFEAQFQTNHLGHFVIAAKLAAQHLKRQKKRGVGSKDLRVVMVTSMAHLGGKLDFQDLQAQQSYKPFRSYAQSKLANVMTAVELQQRYQRLQSPESKAGPCPFAAVAVHPGLVDTDLARNYFETDWLWPWLRPIGRHILRPMFPLLLLPASLSARTVSWAAFAPAEQVAGQYVSDCRVVKLAASDAVQRQRLWDVSCELAKIADPL